MAFRRGDQQALRRVYEHYFPLVAGLVSRGFSFDSGGQPMRFRGAGASPDAFDLVHDVFTALFEVGARRSYNGTVPYAAYVTTTARNRIISRLRRDKARFVTLDEDAGDAAARVSDGAPSPEQQLMNREAEALVRRYLDEQSPLARALARCRFAEDLSQEETARALDLSRKQVRRLEAALRKGLLHRLRGVSPHGLSGFAALLVLA